MLISAMLSTMSKRAQTTSETERYGSVTLKKAVRSDADKAKKAALPYGSEHEKSRAFEYQMVGFMRLLRETSFPHDARMFLDELGRDIIHRRRPVADPAQLLAEFVEKLRGQSKE